MMGDSPSGSPMDISEKDICDLLHYFSRNTYSVPQQNDEPRSYIFDVMKLMEKDYIIGRVENKDGMLCPQYPAIIPIMESARSVTTIYENEAEATSNKVDVTALTFLFNAAKLARCRQRFPVPVIFLNGKHICRSSTLATEPEMCYRTGLANVPGYELLKSVKELWWPTEGLGPNPEVYEEAPEGPGLYENDFMAKSICDRVRNYDINLLKSLNVNTIVDIMVEKRKVKHTLFVSASEKVDVVRYSTFKLLSLPYPGCEFFKDYHDALFIAEGLKYKWNDPANDAVFTVPNDNIKRSLGINWEDYKEWDLVLITQNYMKYILKRLQEDDSGLLVHCISGWDRTPLFISLIRLSLWADSLIHSSLNEFEILYLTLAYDWYLFGHHLSNRLYKNEEIMAFCFDFLRYITGDEFSFKTSKKKHSDELKTDESRSPSRSSCSSTSTDEILGHRRKKLCVEPIQFVETIEDSCDIPMDTEFEDYRLPFDEDAMDTTNGVNGNGSVTPFEITVTGMLNGDDLSRSRVSSATQPLRRTSPIPAAGPSRRQRTDSGSSNISTTSWQIITGSGSMERDMHLKPLRYQRLERVRSIFASCYQRAVKNESFGPPKKWMIEELVGNISNWSQWFDFLPETNSNVDSVSSLDDYDFGETNGNGRDENQTDPTDNVDTVADSVNSNE